MRAVLIAVSVMVFGGAALADGVCEPPPMRMSLLAAARLELAVLKFNVKAAELAPLEQELLRLLAEVQIAPAELDRSVRVDYTTGEIRRPPPMTAAAMAAMAAISAAAAPSPPKTPTKGPQNGAAH